MIPREDHEVFFDREDIKIGSRWHEQIADRVKHCEWFIPLVSLAYVNSRYIVDNPLTRAATLLDQGDLRGLLHVNMAYDGDAPDAVASVLKRVQFFKWRSPDDTLRLAREIAEVIPPPQTMLKGMRPFTETDGALFHSLGREAEIASFRRLLETTQARYVLIHGVSGAGKTSPLSGRACCPCFATKPPLWNCSTRSRTGCARSSNRRPTCSSISSITL